MELFHRHHQHYELVDVLAQFQYSRFAVDHDDLVAQLFVRIPELENDLAAGFDRVVKSLQAPVTDQSRGTFDLKRRFNERFMPVQLNIDVERTF